MNVDTLSKLLEIAPTMDEQTDAEKKIMQEGTRRVGDYGIVEQFFFTLCDFYNLQQRLKLWMFKQNFDKIIVSEIRKFFGMLGPSDIRKVQQLMLPSNDCHY